MIVKMKSKGIIKGLVGLLLLVTFDSNGQLPIAEGQEKWLGNIYSGSQIFNYDRYWNQVTPENAGKWGSVESTRDVYNWGQLDAAYELAKENGFPFRFHVLIWGNQQPNWIASLSEEEQLEEIAEWMDTVAARYPDIDYLEVVNEPIHDAPFGAENGGYASALGGSGETGWDWIVTAFRMARERFPNSKLVINDYNIVSNQNNVNRYLWIIETLQAENLLDVIGVQAHAFSTRGSAESMRDILDQLAETGLPIMATEMDVDGVDALGNEDDQVQLEDMQRIFPVFWEHPAVIGVTFWGWRPGLWRNEEAAYLIDQQGLERPALEWLRTYVARTSGVLGTAEDRKLEIFPNPVSDHVIFVQTPESAKEILVMDMSGKVLQREIPKSQKTRITLDESLQSGIYMLQVIRLDGSKRTEKIIIE